MNLANDTHGVLFKSFIDACDFPAFYESGGDQ